MGDYPCSKEYLLTIDHAKHSGLPSDFMGINLNSKILKLHVGQFNSDFILRAQQKSDELDEELQDLLGAKLCALKMFYPAGGYIDWHTNWDNPGYNIIFTYSASGDGYWRHIDPSAAASLIPDYAKVKEIKDQAGWNCKAGYFGNRAETNRLMWHCAYTREPRLTLSYIIQDKAIWENLVAELQMGGANA